MSSKTVLKASLLGTVYFGIFFLTRISVNDACKTMFFKEKIEGKALKNHVFHTTKSGSQEFCRALCYLDDRCLSYNYGTSADGDTEMCELSESDHVLHGEDLTDRPNTEYLRAENDCDCPKNKTCRYNFVDNSHYCECKTGSQCNDSKPTTGSPAELTTTGSPAEQTTTGSLAEQTTTGSPGELTTTGSPAEQTTTGSPAQLTTTGPPVEQTTTGSPAEQTTTGSPAELTTTGPPVELTTTGPPVEQTTTGFPAEQTTTGSTAELTTTGSPTEQTTTGSPGGLVTTGAPGGLVTSGSPGGPITSGSPFGPTTEQSTPTDVATTQAQTTTAASSGSDCELQFSVASTSNMIMVTTPFSSPLQMFTISFWLKVPSSSLILYPFSYATSSQTSALSIAIKEDATMEVSLNGGGKSIPSFLQRNNAWQHFAIAWKSASGGINLYYNGGEQTSSESGLQQGDSVPTGGLLIVGQQQGGYGEGFDETKTMKGNIAGLNFWSSAFTKDYVSANIYNKNCGIPSGDALSWATILQGQIVGTLPKVCPANCRRS